ncbi:MAG: M3 family metallopeptidase [Pseudomonadota bacterium]|nr:M3 family metallopeptidase [Pseudomonadota bacterium]
MDNPLLEFNGLPRFSAIRPEHAEPAITGVIEDNRRRIQALLEQEGTPTWENLVEPLEVLQDRLDRVFAPISHLNSVKDSEGWRNAFNACLPKLSEYGTELGHNHALYEAFHEIAASADYARYSPAQRRVIDNALRDFKLAGVTLGGEDKARFKVIMQELSRLGAKFQENLLDATRAWNKPLGDAQALNGLPESAIAQLRQYAEREGQEGYLVTLEFPSYHAVMTYADDRELRRAVYEAYTTRASDQGPHGGRWDNTSVMEDILRLRHEAARILGYADYAEQSLATKMAPDVDAVNEFLLDLVQRSRPVAQSELDELTDFAAQTDGIKPLEAWDIAYYSEKLRVAKHALSQEDLRPYFPAPRVIEGMFGLVQRLYGVQIAEGHHGELWHPDVKFFEIRDPDGRLRGQFFTDLYARSDKRGGAWMADCVGRRLVGAHVQTPVAFLVCNFTPPLGDQPAQLTHDEVVTLFHEFGHGLHHMLTKVDYLPISGINGVEWDAVELPSQFMENWCWQREVLDLISAHVQTGDRLPDELFARMIDAKNFQSGMQMVRQLEFALFDLRLHSDYDPEKGGRVQEVIDAIRERVAVVYPPAWNRFPHSFSHIFAGGYAAGYYSYKWAEVLSADAFAAFEERGLFDPAIGRHFLEAILEQGGSRDARDSFIAFRGREPNIEPLLRHSGIAA